MKTRLDQSQSMSVSLSDEQRTRDSLAVRELVVGGTVSGSKTTLSSRSNNWPHESQNVLLASKCTNLNSKCAGLASGQVNLGGGSFGPFTIAPLESHTTSEVRVKKMFKCPLCDYANSRLYNLNRHLRCHTGNKFRCDRCDSDYNCKYKLQQHKVLKHGYEQNLPHGYDYRQANRMSCDSSFISKCVLDTDSGETVTLGSNNLPSIRVKDEN